MGKPPVIMQIAGSLGIGGAEGIAMALAQCVRTYGWESIYVSATNHRNRAQFRQKLREKGVFVWELGGHLASKWRVVGNLARIVQPTVIHTHTELPEMLGLAAKYAVPSAQLLRTVHNTVHWPGHWMLGGCVDFCYRLWGSHQYACSQDVAKPGDEIITNGILWTRDMPIKVAGEVVFVGRLEKQKQPADVIRIVDQVRPTHSLVHLTMVGDGSLKKGLMRQFSPPWLTWAGATDDSRPYLSRARVVLLASAFEGLPLVVLEALTTLTWVLAPDIAGLRHLPWVVCYPPGDFKTAARLLRDLLERDPSELDGLRNVFREQYSQDVMLDRYMRSYQTLVPIRPSYGVMPR